MVPSARDARNWVADGGLHGIGTGPYTPFKGTDGDEIDWDAYRSLVRYCIGELHHEMIWLVSGVGEWWSLTLDERKKLAEVGIAEARSVAPETVIQVATVAASAKDCVELTQHAQGAGADICFIQTPPMEAHGGDGILRYMQYVADRTDIALGIFPSPSSGYLMTPQDVAQVANGIPAICAMKEGHMIPAMAKACHALAPELYIWETNSIAYEAGWLQKGIVGAAQLCPGGFLYETPEKLIFREYWNLIWDGQLLEAVLHAKESGLDGISEGLGGWRTTHPARPGYLTHWGEAFKCAATMLGLPPGEYPYSRPPQAFLPEHAKEQIRATYERSGLMKESAAA
jgi:4-hydroxy-tetrahydrodipicolinate synthase